MPRLQRGGAEEDYREDRQEPEVQRLIDDHELEPVAEARAVLRRVGKDVADARCRLLALAEGIEQKRHTRAHADALVAQVESIEQVGGSAGAGENDGAEKILH